MGLAPKFIAQIFEIIKGIKKQGVTILLVEQNAAKALSVADRAYVLETGNITMQGSGAELLKDPAVRKAYLGHGA
jgi:branched-chain amino acid transport system ATP-binding protein